MCWTMESKMTHQTWWSGEPLHSCEIIAKSYSVHFYITTRNDYLRPFNLSYQENMIMKLFNRNIWMYRSGRFFNAFSRWILYNISKSCLFKESCLQCYVFAGKWIIKIMIERVIPNGGNGLCWSQVFMSRL